MVSTYVVVFWYKYSCHILGLLFIAFKIQRGLKSNRKGQNFPLYACDSQAVAPTWQKYRNHFHFLFKCLSNSIPGKMLWNSIREVSNRSNFMTLSVLIWTIKCIFSWSSKDPPISNTRLTSSDEVYHQPWILSSFFTSSLCCFTNFICLL